MSAAAAEATGTHHDEAVWHNLSAEVVCAQLGVDPKSGLDAGEVEKRRAQYGPNPAKVSSNRSMQARTSVCAPVPGSAGPPARSRCRSGSTGNNHPPSGGAW